MTEPTLEEIGVWVKLPEYRRLTYSESLFRSVLDAVDPGKLSAEQKLLLKVLGYRLPVKGAEHESA